MYEGKGFTCIHLHVFYHLYATIWSLFYAFMSLNNCTSRLLTWHAT